MLSSMSVPQPINSCLFLLRLFLRGDGTGEQ
ncbi:Hypothetical protein BMEA_A1579 [Brucella melitensis ATCC 23457]|uniref:Uncharacterized protein n=1 Tax=Brucella melitensis biotype 2 (strain ATCC 23457) TaxID=546272 RepID=C0REG0_BRUMB|nr:Hypothetical protein BMEA_A1579 [Brucella melitensis ATCC 23457]